MAMSPACHRQENRAKAPSWSAVSPQKCVGISKYELSISDIARLWRNSAAKLNKKVQRWRTERAEILNCIIGSNMYVDDREENFSVFLEAAISGPLCQRLWLLCRRRKQLTGWQQSHPKPVNVHPANGLRLARLDVFHLACQVQTALWQPGSQQHQRHARWCHWEHGALQSYPMPYLLTYLLTFGSNAWHGTKGRRYAYAKIGCILSAHFKKIEYA